MDSNHSLLQNAKRTHSGLWRVRNRGFQNKRECLAYATSVRASFHEISYHFYDDVYRSLDWSREPETTLDELYKTRALQIRDKYKYVALAFSGGSDSTNILDTFLKNNIQLDEVCVFCPIEAAEKFKSKFDPRATSAYNMMFEYFDLKPKLDCLAKNHPNIKITVIDTTRTISKMVEDQQLHKVALGGHGFAGVLFNGTYHIIDRVQQNSKQGVGYVFGVDKPYIRYKRDIDRFGMFFPDLCTLNGQYSTEWGRNFEVNCEYFYHTPDLPQIVQKQCFIIKKILKPMIDAGDHTFKHLVKRYLSDTEFVFNHEHPFFENIIYSNFNSSDYQADKPSSSFFPEGASWMWNANQTKFSKQLVDSYHGQVEDFVSGVSPDFLERDENNSPKYFKIIPTKSIWF